MKTNTPIILVIIFALIFQPALIAANSGSDEVDFTHIAPTENRGGSGEFVHGAGHGKLLIRVLLLGAVGQQGIHYFPEDTHLLDAILYSGGIADSTKLNGITIRRKGQKELIEVDLEDLMEDGDPFPILLDGDTVNIDWNWRKDIGNITLVTGFISSITAFTLAMIALAN